MKKLAGCIALLLLIAAGPGCKKTEAQPQLTEQKAYLNLANLPADGPSVDELVLDSTHETIVPINKKDGWPQSQQGQIPVMIRFVETGKNITMVQNGQTWHLREVYLVSFRPL